MPLTGLNGDGTPARIQDELANCLNGSATSSATASADGPTGIGGGITSASDQLAVLAASGNLPTGNDSRSLETWFKQDGDDGVQSLMRYGNNFGIAYDDNGSFVVSTGLNTTDLHRFNLPVGQSITDGVWHHIVVTFDGASVRVHLDGFLVGSELLDVSVDTSLAGGGLRVGEHAGSYSGFAVYPAVLTDSEIAEHWTLGASSRTDACSDAPTDPYGAAVIADGADLYMPLAGLNGDGTPARVQDDFANCLNGSATSNATAATDSPAGLGGALTAPTNELAALASSGNLPIGDAERSLETWFKTDATDGDQWLMRYGNNFGFYHDDNGSLVVVTGLNTNDRHRFFLPAGLSVTDDVWHHIVLTFDGATVRIYLDAQLVGFELLDVFVDTSLDQGGLQIGDHVGSYSGVAVYPTALTQQQITDHLTVGNTIG